MLMELGEINEDVRISSMVQLCEYFSEHINESNCLNMYSSTMANTLQYMHVTRLWENYKCSVQGGFVPFLPPTVFACTSIM